MRGLALLAVVLTLAGCNAVRDAFSAHSTIAGSAAGETLSVARLADLAGHAKRVPLRSDILSGLAAVYLDYAVFAVEVARGRDLDDSALVLAAEWPTVSQLRQIHLHERLIAARGKITPAEADSVYRSGTPRIFQHILLRVPPNAPPALEQEKKQRAQSLRHQVAAGGGRSFAQLAQRYSEDPGSKQRGGYLPALGRGQFVPAFDSAAWQLAPGAVSGVVRSAFGFHIIRRPPLDEVRDSLMASLQHTRTVHFDSLYLDSLVRARDLQVESAAPALVRQAAPQIVAAREDGRTLATYRGGAFRVKDFVRRLLAVNPEDIRGITNASDGQLRQFVRQVAELELVAQEADAAGVQLTPEDWRHVRAEHDSTLATLETVTGISPQLVKDSAAGEQARTALAMAHLNAYLDRALADGRLFPVPPFLAGALRQGAPWSLNEAGIARALERAQAIRADSGPTAAPATGFKRAPGPPPVPTDSPARGAH
ncbi:MAG TPA: peptidylprolyl isomerase [Gemmatimonadales bacterium]|nr:peptidylprolyl isomerase [Gemmatimonadales bacterium]